jgi:hypothetical protein
MGASGLQLTMSIGSSLYTTLSNAVQGRIREPAWRESALTTRRHGIGSRQDTSRKSTQLILIQNDK